jgi:hypothetical protein
LLNFVVFGGLYLFIISSFEICALPSLQELIVFVSFPIPHLFSPLFVSPVIYLFIYFCVCVGFINSAPSPRNDEFSNQVR